MPWGWDGHHGFSLLGEVRPNEMPSQLAAYIVKSRTPTRKCQGPGKGLQCPALDEVPREKWWIWVERDKLAWTRDSKENTGGMLKGLWPTMYYSFSITLYFGSLSHTSPQETTLPSFTNPAKPWNRWSSVPGSSMELNEFLLRVNHC